MYATLMDESGERELNTLSDKKARTMTGSVVASLAHLKDIDGNDGAFFVFPDLSVRCEGVYRLKFSLFEIVGNQIFFCKSITSDSFTVYSAKKFPGMEESTRLTKLFAEQGLKIRVRKEQKSTRPKGARSRPIATALQSDNTPSTHRSHLPAWNSDHRLPASVGMAYANPPPHHFERQPYSAATMPSNVTSAGSAAQAGGGGGGGGASSSLLRETPPTGSWSGAPMRGAHNSNSALSHSPPLQSSVSQYASMSDMQRNPDSESAGHQHYGQHRQQQHKSLRGVSPSHHNPSYRSRQQAASHTHPTANTLSSPNMDAGHSAFSALPPGSQRLPAPHPQYQSQSLTMSKPRIRPQSQSQHPQHHTSSMLPRSLYGSAHMLPPISGQGPGHMVHSPDHRSQQPYRYAPAPEDDVRSPHHQYSQRRPWSPHHRSQQQHYSPTHTGHGFGSEPRYSPYTRQVDAPPRDPRQHLSPGPGARITGSFVSPAVSETPPIYPEPPSSFRHQQHPLPTRAQPVDNLQYYHLAPTQRPAQHATVSPLAPDAATPSHGLPPPPPPVPLYAKHGELSPVVALDSPSASASAPSQQRRIAVHSLLISDSSSSPEKANGSPQ
ncbi:hypothetical protein H4S03_008828 [Coemansia sp. S3946]|nr:hypothetical protein H4S03_008828 [Coemansia sp. S3946]